MRQGIVVLISILFSCSVFPSEKKNNLIDLKPILIERKESEFAKSQNISSFEVYSYREFSAFVSDSSEDILDYFSSADLRKRGYFGVQQDLSIRGSIFEDNNILINGIEVNEPQTGHFSLELPFTTEDLEKVNLEKNKQAVNFILKEPEAKGFLLKSSFGKCALFENLLSANFSFKAVKNRLSLEHKSSKGKIKDTDFDIYRVSFDSLYREDNQEFEFLYGFLKKDFGADSFYAWPKFRQEEEHTSQQFFSLRSLFKKDYFNLQLTPFFRRHFDKFILDRYNPSFYTNYHTTYIYGLNSRLDIKDWGLFFQSGFREEKITSTNLGRQKRLKESLSLGISPKRLGDFFLGMDFKADHYSDWQWLNSLNINLSFPRDNFIFRFCFDKIYRIPSFTELFYSSPSNQGNPNLSLQKMDNFELGFDYFSNPKKLTNGKDDYFKIGVSFFLRKQQDTIDWVKNFPNLPWQAKNVGNIRARGVDLDLDLPFKDSILKKLSLKYTFLNLNNKNPYNYSKYLFNYLKHKLLVNLKIYLSDNLSVLPVFIFEEPINNPSRTVFNLKISYKVNKSLSLFLEGENLFNEEYQELEGIRGKPRWEKFGFKYKF